MKTRRLLWLTALGLGGSAAIPPLIAETPKASTPTQIAQVEYEEVMKLDPNLENGRETFLTCAVCHQPEGWGTPDGKYPQIAGQIKSVIIKQLADIRARNRDNPLMYPFSVASVLGGPQDIADVAAYVARLPMTPRNGVGPGNDLALGKQLFEDNCVKCHGKKGEGDAKEHIPAIAGQHYNYLTRQFDMIRANRRKNADPKMVKQIKGFSSREELAVLDYVSRLRPPPEKLAQFDWLNPDFPNYERPPAPEPLPIAPMPVLPAMPEPPAMPSMPKPPQPPTHPGMR